MTNGVNQLKQHQDDQDRQQERRDIEAWLTATDYSSQQRHFIATRREATGEWLLTSEEFQKWLATNKSTLYCPGIPGSGKTIMSAVVVNHLLTSYRDEPSIGIAYVYCNYGLQEEQTLENIHSY
jgi:Cdc6-like AAA superfamily ATPase